MIVLESKTSVLLEINDKKNDSNTKYAFCHFLHCFEMSKGGKKYCKVKTIFETYLLFNIYNRIFLLHYSKLF